MSVTLARRSAAVDVITTNLSNAGMELFWDLMSTSPYIIVAGYVAAIILTRDMEYAIFFMGQLMNETLCLLLKNTIRHERPKGSPKSDFGMPSQHSQFMSYFVTYSILLMFFRKRVKSLYILILVSLLILVVYSRVYLLYHFWSQIFVGLGIGSVWSVIYFRLIHLFDLDQFKIQGFDFKLKTIRGGKFN